MLSCQVYGLRGVSWWLCVCFIWLDMTTPPWCREKVMVYYYYFFYTTRPALNNFRIIYNRDRSTADVRIWWQVLLTHVNMLQIPSANWSLLDIYQPIERDSASRWLSACYETCRYVSADVIYQPTKTWLDVSRIISMWRNLSVRFCWRYYHFDL